MNEFLPINLSSASFERAVSKVAEMRPMVRLGVADDSAATYLVRRSDGISWASVMFVRSPSGCALFRCSCPAGEKGRGCYHVAAALMVHCGLVRAGLRVKISRCVWLPRLKGRGFVHQLHQAAA